MQLRARQHPAFGPAATFAKVYRLFGIRGEAPEKRTGNTPARKSRGGRSSGGRRLARRTSRAAMQKRSRRINRLVARHG